VFSPSGTADIFTGISLFSAQKIKFLHYKKRKAVIMLDFKKILVPYDGSSHAKKALNQAISLAQCSDGAELYVATILNSTIPADDDPDQVDMAEVEKLIPENIPHKVLLEMGEPVPMLLYLAGEIGADLIITGSRGRGALKSLFMGSVSSGILKNAKCPVFIIK
jgi:nucleotide-binding universal stress UspA family protein